MVGGNKSCAHEEMHDHLQGAATLSQGFPRAESQKYYRDHIFETPSNIGTDHQAITGPPIK